MSHLRKNGWIDSRSAHFVLSKMSRNSWSTTGILLEMEVFSTLSFAESNIRRPRCSRSIVSSMAAIEHGHLS